jgi:hypothetical protein
MATVATADDELREIVLKIQATEPNASLIRTATANLAELLNSAPQEPSFDLQSWRRQWSELEAEMRAVSHTNDIAEGRGE